MLVKTTRKLVLLMVVTATVAFGLARSAPVASQDDPDTEAKIENAMSAAPSGISDNATILEYEMDDAGEFVVLREGSNDWYCFPDTPGARLMIPPATTQHGWSGCMPSLPAKSRR
jgi:hypothetical protein